MSHFTVLVIGEDLEGALAPFQENNIGNCPKEYLKFFDMEDEGRQEFETGESSKGIKHKERYADFDEFMNDWYGYSKDPETERYGYWENPNAKWDWYQIGGRWTGFFKLKNGGNDTDVAEVGSPGLLTQPAKDGYVDRCRVGDIDFTGMQEDTIKNAEKAWAEAEKEAPVNRYFMYGIKDGQTKEQYLNCRTQGFTTTHAVIKDGKWYQAGQMGWWGVVSDKKEEDDWNEEYMKFLNSLPPETIVTVVDCHI